MIRHTFNLLIVNLLCLTPNLISGQSYGNEGRVLLTNFTYAFHVPAGDLSDRFGTNGSVGGGMELLFKNNLLFGFQANMHFGNRVKEDVLSILRAEDGQIFADLGFPANV
ncbi:MAG: hypothetical protein D6714_01170, partial [Bacteroidetes bacterium]